MDALGIHPRPDKVVTQPLAHMFGVAEQDHPLVALVLYQPQGRFRLGQGAGGDTVLVDVRPVLLLGGHGNLHLVPLVHPGDGHNLLGNGGGEQAHILAVFDPVQDLGHIFEKAHVQHPVGLIQHHGLNLIQTQGLAVVVIHEPAGGGHHDLGLPLQGLDLAADAGAAVDHRHPDAGVIGQQAPQLIADLDRQFPGGSQNQALQVLTGGINMFNHGNAEGKGLARSSGCLCDYIPPLQQRRNGLLLNGGRVSVALLLQGLEHGLGKAQLLKCQIVCHL